MSDSTKKRTYKTACIYTVQVKQTAKNTAISYVGALNNLYTTNPSILMRLPHKGPRPEQRACSRKRLGTVRMRRIIGWWTESAAAQVLKSDGNVCALVRISAETKTKPSG
jgi:hypothetical protein